MAWTPIADDFDAFSAAVVSEYSGALNERCQALGLAPAFAAYAEDDDVPNSAAIISAWQQWVETNLTSFVVSHDGVAGAAVPRAAGYYDNAVTVDTYADLAAVFSAAGLAPQVNWRRIRDHAFFAWGQAQEDDDYGGALAIFEDLQKVLSVLVWTRYSPNPGDFVDSVYYRGFGVSGVSWAAAKALAEADYKEVVTDPNQLFCDSAGWGAWNAALDHFEARMSVVGVWNGVTRHADWYVKTIYWVGLSGPGDWDDYGDDVLEDVFSLFSQDEPATNDTTIVSATKLGTAATMPNTPWCNYDPAGAGRGWMAREYGYEGERYCVVRWNVAGGFSYA